MNGIQLPVAVGKLGDGDFCGEAMLTGHLCDVSVVADAPCECFVLTEASLADALEWFASRPAPLRTHHHQQSSVLALPPLHHPPTTTSKAPYTHPSHPHPPAKLYDPCAPRALAPMPAVPQKPPRALGARSFAAQVPRGQGGHRRSHRFREAVARRPAEPQPAPRGRGRFSVARPGVARRRLPPGLLQR